MRTLLCILMWVAACDEAEPPPVAPPQTREPTAVRAEQAEAQPEPVAEEVAEPEVPPLPVLSGPVNAVEDFAEDELLLLGVFIDQGPVRRPSGRRIGLLNTNYGQWQIVPIAEVPKVYETVTLLGGGHGVHVIPVTRMRTFFATMDNPDTDVGGVISTSFLALEIEQPDADAGGFWGVAGATVHEIPIDPSSMRRARRSLVQRIEPYDEDAEYVDPLPFDGTVRALHLPSYDFVLISGKSRFVLHGSELYSIRDDLMNVYEADGRGLFFAWSAPDSSWVTTLPQFCASRRALGPDDAIR